MVPVGSWSDFSLIPAKRLFFFLQSIEHVRTQLFQHVLTVFWLHLTSFSNRRQEFVQFLIYAFGEELEFAWEELDDDGSGELSEEEWFQAVKRIGRDG